MSGHIQNAGQGRRLEFGMSVHAGDADMEMSAFELQLLLGQGQVFPGTKDEYERGEVDWNAFPKQLHVHSPSADPMAVGRAMYAALERAAENCPRIPGTSLTEREYQAAAWDRAACLRVLQMLDSATPAPPEDEEYAAWLREILDQEREFPGMGKARLEQAGYSPQDAGMLLAMYAEKEGLTLRPDFGALADIPEPEDYFEAVGADFTSGAPGPEKKPELERQRLGDYFAIAPEAEARLAGQWERAWEDIKSAISRYQKHRQDVNELGDAFALRLLENIAESLFMVWHTSIIFNPTIVLTDSELTLKANSGLLMLEGLLGFADTLTGTIQKLEQAKTAKERGTAMADLFTALTVIFGPEMAMAFARRKSLSWQKFPGSKADAFALTPESMHQAISRSQYGSKAGQIIAVDLKELGFSQTTVSYLKKRELSGRGIIEYTYDDIKLDLYNNGWTKGHPVDAVIMPPDGKLTSMDNTRLTAVLELGGVDRHGRAIRPEVRIRRPDEVLRPSDRERFGRPQRGSFPLTWGDAIRERIRLQNTQIPGQEYRLEQTPQVTNPQTSGR